MHTRSECPFFHNLYKSRLSPFIHNPWPSFGTTVVIFLKKIVSRDLSLCSVCIFVCVFSPWFPPDISPGKNQGMFGFVRSVLSSSSIKSFPFTIDLNLNICVCSHIRFSRMIFRPILRAGPNILQVSDFYQGWFLRKLIVSLYSLRLQKSRFESLFFSNSLASW